MLQLLCFQSLLNFTVVILCFRNHVYILQLSNISKVRLLLFIHSIILTSAEEVIFYLAFVCLLLCNQLHVK